MMHVTSDGSNTVVLKAMIGGLDTEEVNVRH